MDQSELLKELRAQRELIRKHLGWIGRQIAELEANIRAEGGQAAEAASQTEEPAKHQSTPTKEPSKGGIRPEEAYVQSPRAYPPDKGNEVLRVKIGCLVLFVLSTALFLFLLFGLPYLLD
ncbi:MAG: hypothetical protein ACPGIC_04320 [Opitutales bacterium]